MSDKALARFNFWFFLMVAILGLSFSAQAQTNYQPKYEKAVVLSVDTIEAPPLENSSFEEISQHVILRILSGKFKGEKIEIDHIASGMMGTEMILKAGDKVMLYVDEKPTLAESPSGRPIFSVADYLRDRPIFWLACCYAVLLLIVGGLRGLKSLISLVITILLIFVILFPLTLWGFDPLLVSVVIAGLVSLMVFRIVGGKSSKSLAAAVGTLAGVAIAGLLAFLVGRMIHLNGLSTEESRILLYSMNLKINYQGLLFGSILLGALGAVMDVAMSISSAIEEVARVHPKINFSNLFNSGMNVGRDVMGTMSNTLILAYTGSALPLLLLLLANKMSLAKIMNLELIAEEIVRALAGSIGLVLCIPITAAVAAVLIAQKFPLKKD